MSSGFDDVVNPRTLKEFGVGRGTVADVLARIVMAAPDGVPQVDIASGIALPGLAEIPQGSVSRASGLLLSLGLLAKEERRVERPGRPIIPLRLGTEWILAGVKVRHRGGRPAEVAVVVARLDGGKEDRRTVALRGKVDHATLVRTITRIVQKLTSGEDRKLLGIGIELGGHIHQGNVIVVRSPAEHTFRLAEQVSKALSGQPTVVENDVNARAVSEIWKKDPQLNKLRFPQQHFAVVAVFDEAVGASLVIDRRVYRGGHGMAGAIGHLTVDYSRPRRKPSSGHSSSEPGLKNFNDPCLCAPEFAGPDGPGYGHVDALATPARIAGELGIRLSRFTAAAQERYVKRNSVGRTGDAGDAFWTAGKALGHGIAAMLNIANPANLLLLLPPVLANAAEGTRGALYRQAIETTLDKECFSTAAEDARAGKAKLLVEPLDPDDTYAGARAAAACVLDSLIAHARGEDTGSLAPAGGSSTSRFFRAAARE
jgi:hypothetical protein